VVAYFARFDDLARAASILAARLGGVAPHGVPFSAELVAGGLLSWGVDPPAWSGAGAGWDGSGSWRLWLTNLLARALLAAAAGGAAGTADATAAGPLDEPAAARAEAPGAASEAAAGAPWRFALARLRLEGVDTATWAPGAALRQWRQGAPPA
jgi:hypothetical protein